MYKSVLGNINKLHKKGSKIDTPNTQIHDRSLPWFGTGSSIKSGWVKLVLRTQTFLWIFPAPLFQKRVVCVKLDIYNFNFLMTDKCTA